MLGFGNLTKNPIACSFPITRNAGVNIIAFYFLNLRTKIQLDRNATWVENFRVKQLTFLFAKFTKFVCVYVWT